MIWWTKSWNPIIGCTKCSPACANCYAEGLHTQRHKTLLAGKDIKGQSYTEPFGHVRFLQERLDAPLHWRKPQRVFVCNMSDIFHRDVKDEWLDLIFAVMACASPSHIFMLLTKRPERMAAYMGFEYRRERIYKASGESDAFCLDWPLPNVWLGATIWDQSSADRAVPILLNTPAAKRFVSVEPMLGPVKLSRIRVAPDDHTMIDALKGYIITDSTGRGIGRTKLDWVICGGETGPGARPMYPDWPRLLRDQCQAASVPFFFKQWGEWKECDGDFATHWIAPDGHYGGWDDDSPPCRVVHNIRRVGSRRAGRKLDGETWEEVPHA